MTLTVISALASFFLVTVVGGLFAQSLQYRAWSRQQFLNNQDKIITELKTIFVEFDLLLSKRIFRTRRILYALRRGDPEKIRQSLVDYDGVVTEWNDKRNSLQIRLVRVISTRFSEDFEHDLSPKFVGLGAQLEQLAKAADNNSLPRNFKATLSRIEGQLNLLNRSSYEFSRELYKSLQNEQARLYHINKFDRIPETVEELDRISTWFLIKALFVPVSQLSKEL